MHLFLQISLTISFPSSINVEYSLQAMLLVEYTI